MTLNADGSIDLVIDNNVSLNLDANHVLEIVAAFTHRSIEDVKVIAEVERIYRKHRPQGWEPKVGDRFVEPRYSFTRQALDVISTSKVGEYLTSLIFPNTEEGEAAAFAFIEEVKPLWQSYCIAIQRFTKD